MDNDWRNEQIRCEYCGENYAATYKRCPFCDGRGEPMDEDLQEEGLERRRSRRGGRRAAKTNRRGGGYGRHIQPVQVIGLILSMLLVVAAVYIVFTVISPLLVDRQPSGASGSASQSQSGISASVSGEISQPDVSGSQPDAPDVSQPTVDPVVDPTTFTATGITINVSDFTLKPDETYRIRATLEPQGCTDPITWTSSNESAAIVGADGSVSNVNTGVSTIKLTVTATVGDVSTTTIVRCRGGSTGTAGSTATGTTPTPPATTPTTPTVPTTPQTPSGGAVANVTAGKQAVISEGGVRIRSGAGTEHPVQVSASRGAVVTVLEDCGNGWYKIQYIGNGSTKQVGYISGAYLQQK